MVVPIIPLLIGAGMTAGIAGSLYSGHYNRKSLYEQKKIYDAEYNQWKMSKDQYQRNVGRAIRQPFAYDYQMQLNRAKHRQTDYSVHANWGNQTSSMGYGVAGMAGLYGRTQPAYNSGGGSFENWGGMYGNYSKQLYRAGSGKKWL